MTRVAQGDTSQDQHVDPKKARLIQMGEFAKQYVSKQSLAPRTGEISAFMTKMKQVGVGSQGGAEALAIFHQLIFDEWMTGSQETPPARIKVDEKKVLRNDRVECNEDSRKRPPPQPST